MLTKSTPFFSTKDFNPEWYIVDATDKILGRLATEIANILRGKNKANFSPQADCGDYVIVINAEKIKLTGNKLQDKLYSRHSGYIGSLKTNTAEQILEKKPEFIIEHAVKGMLPKNKLSNEIIGKLKVFAGPAHPHGSQKPKEILN